MTQSAKNQIIKDRLPRHIAMIMDGNGRWAKERGMDRIFGHQNGVETVRRMVEACGELGVEYLTLYAFSTENWNRPKHEVNALMELLVSTLRAEIQKLHQNKVRVHTIGCMKDLPEKCQLEIQEAIEQTKNNTGINVVLALSYSAQWDILNACQKLAEECKSMGKDPQHIDAKAFKSALSTSEFPDPELLIRTSGELRISNFLLWELAYSELYFSPVHWPAFQKEDLYQAIIDYQNRERRFGKTSEQITND